ncbi:hypothetical protein RhiJN_26676 [Ceratobasidium sp. AG-Ba]|nr:hypothetical protein RhiJN_12625 [Ceratobasidium sp. AG-Ba]QRV98657.1 hypothetical protein RhiJN_26676 [Ceratobasidium sp. AG-Ba]
MTYPSVGLYTVAGVSSNLSHESLNGRGARKALKDFFTTDLKLYNEILLTSSLNSPFVNLAVEEPAPNEEYGSDDTSPMAMEAVHQLWSAQDVLVQEASRPTSVLGNIESEDYDKDF